MSGDDERLTALRGKVARRSTVRAPDTVNVDDVGIPDDGAKAHPHVEIVQRPKAIDWKAEGGQVVNVSVLVGLGLFAEGQHQSGVPAGRYGGGGERGNGRAHAAKFAIEMGDQVNRAFQNGLTDRRGEIEEKSPRRNAVDLRGEIRG